MLTLCSPAIIYVIFSATQIVIDLYRGFLNTALVKTFVMIMVTLLLNILCERDLGVVSWMIVFIPFILMTVIVSLLLYFFGLNATTGYINNNSQQNQPHKVYTLMNPDTQNNNSYGSQNNNNIQNNPINHSSTLNSIPPPPLFISTSPAYQSI
jgi:predicted membrane protein